MIRYTKRVAVPKDRIWCPDKKSASSGVKNIILITKMQQRRKYFT